MKHPGVSFQQTFVPVVPDDRIDRNVCWRRAWRNARRGAGSWAGRRRIGNGFKLRRIDCITLRAADFRLPVVENVGVQFIRSPLRRTAVIFRQCTLLHSGVRFQCRAVQVFPRNRIGRDDDRFSLRRRRIGDGFKLRRINRISLRAADFRLPAVENVGVLFIRRPFWRTALVFRHFALLHPGVRCQYLAVPVLPTDGMRPDGHRNENRCITDVVLGNAYGRFPAVEGVGVFSVRRTLRRFSVINGHFPSLHAFVPLERRTVPVAPGDRINRLACQYQYQADDAHQRSGGGS